METFPQRNLDVPYYREYLRKKKEDKRRYKKEERQKTEEKKLNYKL